MTRLLPHLLYLLGLGLAVYAGIYLRPLLLRPRKQAPCFPVATEAQDDLLFTRLWQVVEREKLPVLPREWDTWMRKPEAYGKDWAGMYDPHHRIIWMRPKYGRNPWLLAHELGHYFLISEGNMSHSEPEADDRGRQVLLSVITQQEAESVMHRIDVHLPALPA